jgi:hypothetical protein
VHPVDPEEGGLVLVGNLALVGLERLDTRLDVEVVVGLELLVDVETAATAKLLAVVALDGGLREGQVTECTAGHDWIVICP